MLKPPWGLNTPHIRPSDQDSDADLQADIMRFMAILAFCLLAVFALVQSVPKGAQDQSMTQARSGAPVQQNTRPPASNATKETKQSDEAKPTKSSQVPDTTRGVHLHGTNARPEQNEKIVAPKPTRSVPVMNETSSNKLETNPRSQQLPSRTNLSADAHAPTTRHSPRHTPASAQSAEDAEGFALRFESDFALESLVVKKKVQLFGQVGKRTWRLSIRAGHLRFYPTTSPRRFHAMTPESVPVRIATALRRDVSMTDSDRITWGVTLPRATTDQIMRHLRKSAGGTLLIQANGRVRLHDSH